MYQRGDIVTVPFPFTDLSQSKLRPALVISNSTVNKAEEVIIVMITSTARADAMSFQINDSDLSIPLPKNSFVRCHKIVTVSQSIIQKTISKAKPPFVDKVSDKVHHLISELASV